SLCDQHVSLTSAPSVSPNSVTDLPEPTISPVGELIAGKPITLTCTAHPAPQRCKGNITWGGRINIENISNYEREDQAGKVTSISDITVTPSQREHNSPLTCTVTYSGVSTNSSITLDVQYLPEPTISPVGELIAGKPTTLTCTAHPAPQGCKGNITWGGRINIQNIYNYERKDQAGKVTSISDITVTPSQREHNSPLTCTVTYSGVSTNSSITLGVQCKFPLFLFLTHIPYLLTHIGFILE
uniref:Ig-like domain-containing protein n=1 Tax=Xenopus tropicalis TaxID=8364 RepID=K9J7W7_XENTR